MGLILACAPRGPEEPVVINDPCQDPRYLALAEQPVDSLSEREFQLLQQREQACLEVRKALSRVGTKPGPGQSAIRPDQIRTWTEPAEDGNQRIYFENTSDQKVAITGIRLFDCMGIRNTCGAKSLDLELEPGDRRMGYIVRFRPGSTGGSRYRYTFQYEIRSP